MSAVSTGGITSMFGGLVRNLARHLDVEFDEVRQRYEPWYTDHRIECKMMTVEPGGLAGVRFAAEEVRGGIPVVTVERTTRLTPAAARRAGSIRPTGTPVCTR